MQNKRVTQLVALVCAAASHVAIARADTVVLTNGDRIQGEVVGQTDTSLYLRRTYKDSSIRYVQTIPRARVARVEKAGDQPVAPFIPPATLPAEDLSSSFDPPVDKRLHLNAALSKWNDGNMAAAGNELTRLITSSSPEELEAFSREVEAKTKLSLGEMAARAHWEAAHDVRSGRGVHFPTATRYELPYLLPRMMQTYEAALREEITVAPPTTQPGAPVQVAHDDPAAYNRLTIANYLDRPHELRCSKAEANILVAHIQYTLSLLTERMRLDPEVRQNRTLHAALTGQRIRLVALMRAASRLALAPADKAARDRAPATRPAVNAPTERAEPVEQPFESPDRQESLLQQAIRLAREQEAAAAAGATPSAAPATAQPPVPQQPPTPPAPPSQP